MRVFSKEFLEEYKKGATYQSTTNELPQTHKVYTKEPIVHEHVRKEVVEEIQPVIYKETIQPEIIKTTQVELFDTILFTRDTHFLLFSSVFSSPFMNV
jgi:hypothetical protein